MILDREQQFVQGLPRNIFHHDVRGARLRLLAHIEDGYDSWMRKAASSLRLPDEALAVLKLLLRRLAVQRDCFYRNHTVDLWVAGLVNHAHRAPAQFGQDFVTAKPFAPVIVHEFHRSARVCRTTFMHTSPSLPSERALPSVYSPLNG